MVTTEDLAATARRLCASSRRSYVNPFEAVDWPDACATDAWYTSPELISLHGTPAWDDLSEAGRRTLSFWEAVNFYSLNLHGERVLMEGVARRLEQPDLDPVGEYLHHFLDEENGHSVWFGTFCRRYAGRVYPDRTFAFERSYAPGEEDVLFFAQVAVFEELVDRYNATMARDERLVPVARRINALHHAEETRHLVFGRQVVAYLWDRYRPAWGDGTVEGVRRHLGGYLVSTWRAYTNPDAYRDAGLADPADLARRTWESPVSLARRVERSRRALGWLEDLGLVDLCVLDGDDGGDEGGDEGGDPPSDPSPGQFGEDAS